MGNNSSRTQTTAHNTLQNRLANPNIASAPNSGSPSPSPGVPARASSTSSRRTGNRRNSLQPPASQYGRPRQDSLSDLRFATQPRRGSVAETGYGYGGAIPVRTREIEDGISGLRFSSPPPGAQQVAYASAGDRQSGGFAQFAANDGDAALAVAKRRGSMESTTTMDEDEVTPSDTRAVPTEVEWKDGGSAVFLTGTFCSWEKKWPLKKRTHDEVFYAIIPIPPGTHHVKFLVDNELRTSSQLPTAVDETGFLVNYLEVSADDMPPLQQQPSPGSERRPSEPLLSHATPFSAADMSQQYTTEMPAYMRDLMERYGDGSESYDEKDPPAPPSLPMMLQKVILNSNASMKDDPSVLSIPNHVVLNHLATTSIKNGVLGVSATTRYKQKYITTMLFKSAV